MRLGELAQGRANNFQLLRFLAATSVVFFHCFALTNRWTDEPLWRLTRFTGEWNFGALGVQVFFVISGFLVTISYAERARLLPFLAARALRIYPALILATLFTVALAKWSSPLSLPAFLGHPQTLDFIWRSATAWDLRYALPGAFEGNPFARAVNGSLWTLPIEIRLYLFIGLAGVIGLISRRALYLAVAAALIALTIWMPEWLPLAPNDDNVRHAALLFVLGSLAAVWRIRIPISLPVALAAIVLALANPLGGPLGLLCAPLFAYAVLVFAYHPRIQWTAFNRIGDYSYGIYVYAFPIQQTLVERAEITTPYLLLAAALPLAVAVAALSWHGAEKPALGLKSMFRKPG